MIILIIENIFFKVFSNILIKLKKEIFKHSFNNVNILFIKNLIQNKNNKDKIIISYKY